MNVQIKSSDAGRAAAFSRIDALLPQLEEIYVDLHQDPELSVQEVRTASKD